MIVWEGKTASGATVTINDDYMAPRGSELERQRIEEQRRVAYEILRGAAERRAMEADRRAS